MVPLVATAILLVAAGSLTAQSEFPLSGVTWVVQQLDGETPVSERPMTVTFTGGEIQGWGACNMFRAAAILEGPTIKVTGLGQTLMGCAEDDAREDSRLFAAVRALATYQQADNRVLLFDADGRIRLLLVKGDRSRAPGRPVCAMTG